MYTKIYKNAYRHTEGLPTHVLPCTLTYKQYIQYKHTYFVYLCKCVCVKFLGFWKTQHLVELDLLWVNPRFSTWHQSAHHKSWDRKTERMLLFPKSSTVSMFLSLYEAVRPSMTFVQFVSQLSLLISYLLQEIGALPPLMQSILWRTPNVSQPVSSLLWVKKKDHPSPLTWQIWPPVSLQCCSVARLSDNEPQEVKHSLKLAALLQCSHLLPW